MNFFLAVLVVLGFAGALEYLDLPARAQEVVRRGKASLQTLRDPALSDRAKEHALQDHARRLFVLLGILAGGSALALGGPLAMVWGLDRAGVASFYRVLTILQRIDFLVGAMIIGGFAYLLMRQTRSREETDGRYGWHDRLLFRVAFRSTTAQRALADVENALYRKQMDGAYKDNPVFITALPRSGTTMMLRLLSQTPSFASHTYQDMPFVLCPMLWSKFSEHFSEGDVPRERMHGDGIEVSGRSPEAFEEMMWKSFWDDHYQDQEIRPWTPSDTNQEFDAFFEEHMRKIAALRRGSSESGKQLRYVSKNNLNIARLAAPPAPLRKGTFLIPFRDPVQQAASMLRQHRRFLDIHNKDDFVREYMEAIGHHEFGNGLKPVNFENWLSEVTPVPSDLAFWLRYWTVSYSYVLKHARASTVLISYAQLTKAPEATLSRLSSRLGISSGELVSQAQRLRPPRSHPVNPREIPDSVLERSQKVYERLSERAV